MSTPIRRHPDSATLMSFAAGALAEPLAAACSVHASMCAECRAELRERVEDKLLRDLGGLRTVGVAPHAIDNNQQSRLFGNRHGDPILVLLAPA